MPVEAQLSGLVPATTYHYVLVARSPTGTSRGQDRTFTTAPDLDRDRDAFAVPQDCDDGNASIHPGAPEALDDGIDQDCNGDPGVNLDRDGDGVSRPQDCDDSSARIHPGTVDVPQNRIDEDCSGKDAPTPP